MAAEASRSPGRLVYHLSRKEWEVRYAGAGAQSWSAPPEISRRTLQAVSIRGGRTSHAEKQAWSNATHLLLRTKPWSISRNTEFAEVEQLVVVLAVSSSPGHTRSPRAGPARSPCRIHASAHRCEPTATDMAGAARHDHAEICRVPLG